MDQNGYNAFCDETLPMLPLEGNSATVCDTTRELRRFSHCL